MKEPKSRISNNCPRFFPLMYHVAKNLEITTKLRYLAGICSQNFVFKSIAFLFHNAGTSCAKNWTGLIRLELQFFIDRILLTRVDIFFQIVQY